MAEHRQNVFRVGLGSIESRRAADGKLEFDFSRFDKLAQVFWDTGRMDLHETGFIARCGKGGWSGSEIVLEGFPGTVLTANGEPIPVAADGLFLAQVSPSAEGKIVLEARGKGDKKSLVRRFREAVVLPIPTANRR